MKGIMPFVCKYCSKAYLLEVMLAKVTLKYAKTLNFISHQFYLHKGWRTIGSIIFQRYIHLNPILKMVTVKT